MSVVTVKKACSRRIWVPLWYVGIVRGSRQNTSVAGALGAGGLLVDGFHGCKRSSVVHSDGLPTGYGAPPKLPLQRLHKNDDLSMRYSDDGAAHHRQ